MASLIVVCFLYVLRLALISTESTVSTLSTDPCISSFELGFLRQREVGYQLAEDESPICDHYFIDGWYEMFDYVIASTEEGCGTHYNWYRKDELPDDDNVQPTTFCLNIGGGKCGLTNEGFVKKCREDKYVFYLHSLPSCSQAYCIEKLNGTNAPDDTPPDISAIKPQISINVERINEKNELHFFCNFTPPVGTNHFYVTEWGITSGFSWTDYLLSTQPMRYENHNDFMKSTALTETILRQKGFARLGIRIACLTKAMNSPTGILSNARESDSKFCGIEVLDKKVFINATEETTVTLQLTVPFGCSSWETKGCSLDVTMFIPQNSDEKCRITDLTQTDQVDRIDNRCGVRFYNNEVMIPKTIRITSMDGQNVEFRSWKYTLVLGTQQTFIQHPLFQNYIPEKVEVEVSTDMTKINGKWCYSQNDPHMGTFDQLYYENQNPGTYLLYRNKNHNVQVQMKTTQCYGSNRIWCNCGVAVNAGRDVFILDQCPGSNTYWHPMFRCRDRILARSVKRDQSGKNYIVYLPTGTEVHIPLFTSLLNIRIKASLADWQNTDGLCGTFNGNRHDDRFKRPGSTEQDINMSWELTGKPENLFESKNDNVLIPWSMEKLLCHCPHDLIGPGPESYIECQADKSKKCIEDKSETAFEERCSLTRKKRNVHGIHVNKEIDLHISTNTKFVSKQSIFRKHISKRTEYDYASAKFDCLKIFNTSAYQMCSEVPVLDVDSFVEECILDAIATNSMDWTMDHLEALKGQCVYEVKINQPLSAEDLAGTNSSQNGNSSGSLNSTETPAFTQEFLTRLEDVVCLNDCSGKGRCNNSDCICDAGFIGADCSVDASEPPVMSGIPDDGECDLQFRECAKTSVFGMNFVSTPNLTCNIVPFRVSTNKEIQTNDSFRTKGKLETFVEVSCSLTIARKKRSTDSISDDYIAEGYRVSVSNDGVGFSEEDTLVIFDSECVDCKKDNDQIICTEKPGFCVKGGQCYKYGEKHLCYSCEGHNNNLEWTPGPDCPIKIPPTNTKRSLWIIPVVVCPVIVIVIIVLSICYVQGKKTLPNTYTPDVLFDAKPDKNDKTNFSI